MTVAMKKFRREACTVQFNELQVFVAKTKRLVSIERIGKAPHKMLDEIRRKFGF
ncbi:hypothetical protein [Neorhizobium sp. NCHU2750]|uniref:hypothetical protein n=1 Tax=Neorhizobium sp. NCHU2750 TaxID=1825976 RepID=UPI000EB6AA38|nr:hypothetical protein NCHU2750_04120 [Neorhizobium sp. NCHU2750]